MPRHSIKEIEDEAIKLLNTKTTFAYLTYLTEPVRSYENEFAELEDAGEIIDGPRIWTFYAGSDFLRGDSDNAYTHNESFALSVLVYDDNYAGAEKAAAGTELTRHKYHPGTRQMIEDVKDRLLSVKLFQDTMPLVLEGVERVETSVRHVSIYTVRLRTEFDYFGPVTT